MILRGLLTRARSAAVATAFVAFVIPGLARADGGPDEFGARHQVVVSVEHLAGYAHTSTTGGSDTTTGIVDGDSSANDAWLFGNAYWPNASLSPSSGYTAHRLAVDVFLTEHVSLGTSALFSRFQSPSNWHVVIGPRLGVAYGLGQRWSVWGRVGFTYVYQGDSLGGFDATTDLYALSADVPFVLRAGHGLFVSLAPTLDVGIGGLAHVQNPFTRPHTRSIRQTSFGIQCALGAYF
jgi:hypothetical protein